MMAKIHQAGAGHASYVSLDFQSYQYLQTESPLSGNPATKA
jgi:hypothetical protein